MTENASEPAVPEPVDVRNNRESAAAAADTSSTTARASDGGAPPKDAPSAGELPETVEGGAASGNPVAGVTISEEGKRSRSSSLLGKKKEKGETSSQGS